MPAPKEEKRPTRPDLYASHLLPAAPVRGAKAPGASKLTNMHVMIEFSLQVSVQCSGAYIYYHAWIVYKV